jgi:hypothetical protein
MNKDAMEGEGVMLFAGSGGFYKGEWFKNKRHGEGTLVSADQERYSGFWEKGLRSGLGSQTYKNYDRYEGRWEVDRSVASFWTLGNTRTSMTSRDSSTPNPESAPAGT